jgi:hypothetical protein
MNLVKNQKLWFVGAGNFAGNRGIVNVAAVGRKWATVEGVFRGRIDLATMLADAGQYSSPGKCYLSEEDWVAQEGSRHAYQALRSNLAPKCPPDVSLEAIIQAGKLLGLDIEVLTKTWR